MRLEREHQDYAWPIISNREGKADGLTLENLFPTEETFRSKDYRGLGAAMGLEGCLGEAQSHAGKADFLDLCNTQ